MQTVWKDQAHTFLLLLISIELLDKNQFYVCTCQEILWAFKLNDSLLTFRQSISLEVCWVENRIFSCENAALQVLKCSVCVSVCVCVFKLKFYSFLSQIKSDQVRSSQIKSDQVRSSQIKLDQVRSSQIKSDQFRSIQLITSMQCQRQVLTGMQCLWQLIDCMQSLWQLLTTYHKHAVLLSLSSIPSLSSSQELRSACYYCSHVVYGLDGELVSGPVRTHSHCREVQLWQGDPLYAAGGWVSLAKYVTF